MQRLPDPMQWLAAGVPLTLLMDLYEASPARSQRIMADEPSDLSWLPPVPRSRRHAAA